MEDQTKVEAQKLQEFTSVEQMMEEFQKKFETIQCNKLDLPERYKDYENDEEFKKIKKKTKKYSQAIGKQDENLNDSIIKLSKDTRNQNEAYAKVNKIYQQVNEEHKSAQLENEKSKKSKKLLEDLYNNFHEKYNQACEKHNQEIEEQKNKKVKLGESFQDRFKQLQADVDAQTKKRIEIQQEHETLREKLNAVNKQYDTRELLFETEIKKKEIEMQISETQFKQQLIMLEKQTSFEGGDVQTQIQKLEEIDGKLTNKVAVFESKNEDFTQILTMTNENFVSYKNLMESLQKQIAENEAENRQLKEKSAKTSEYLFNQIQEFSKVKGEQNVQKQQLQTLQSLYDMVSKDLAKRETS